MSNSPSKWIVSSGSDLTQDPDLLPVVPGQGLTAQRAPLFSTDVQTARSGRERRMANWPVPRWLYQVGFEVLRDRTALPELAKFMGFFSNHQGRAKEFFFLDPSDTAIVDQAIGIGNASNKDFYLLRNTGYGNDTFLERVMGTLDAPVVKVGGSVVTATLGAYGKISLAAAPANTAVVTWSGTGLRLVRFEEDQLTTAQLAYQLWALGTLKLRTVVR
jgi:uncharacterized protein (TIGR02217 family)